MKHSGEFNYEDYRSSMPPRVFGSETEFTTDTNVQAIFYDDYGKGKSGEDMVRFADPEYLLAHSRDRDNFYLTTGGKLYFDIGNLEYATPECTSPKELVRHERAGEQLVTEYVERVAKELRQPTRTSKRSGFANVERNGRLLMYEDSLGHHENYSSINILSTVKYTNNPFDPDEKSRAMNSFVEARGFADFLALRKLIDGMGMVNEDGYSISQKPTAINYRKYTTGTSHGSKKPFMQHGSNRLEVRSGEGNKSDYAMQLKFGLTSLVIRLIEHNAYPERLLLQSPNLAVEAISHDPHADVMLENGLAMKGADVLKGIVDAAIDLHLQFPDAPKYELEAAEKFYKFYEDLQNVSLPHDDVTALADRIDWAARYQHLLDQGATYEKITTKNLQMVREDLLWDMLGEPDIAREQYRKFGHTAVRVEIPKPPKSRARARSKIAGKAFRADDFFYMQWNRVVTRSGEVHHFDDPHSSAKTLTYDNTRYRR